MEVISFKIDAKFGSFTKPVSTSGGLLSYKVPPKTAIRGMLGSMAGFDFQELLSFLDGLKIGLIPLSEPQTKTTTFNSHYGNPRGRMVNIRQEILINPSYLVITDFRDVDGNHESIEKINELLRNNGRDKSISTIYEGYDELLNNNISYYETYMGKNNFPLNLTTINQDLKRIQKPYGKEFEAKGIVPHEISSDFRVEEKSKKGEGLNLVTPKTLKFHILKDLPIEQNGDREYTITKDFIMKSIDERAKLKLTVEERNYDYKYLVNEQDQLYVLF